MVPGRFYQTNLIRWREGNLCPVGGWDRISPQPLATAPRAGHVWSDLNYNMHRLVLCDGNVYRVENNVWTDITPDDFVNPEEALSARGYGSGNYGLADYGQDDDPRGGSTLFANLPVSYTIDNWNDEILFSTSVDGRVFVWDPENPTPKAVRAGGVGFPNLIQTFLVTEERHLMCFGGDGFPNRVAWSDQGNRERWDYANVTGQAGFKDLEGAGTIYAARKIPGGILIFTQTAVWLGSYVGAPYFYGFRKVAEHLAPVSPQAIGVAAGKAFWMTAKGFAQYVAGVVQPLRCSLDLDPAESLDTSFAPRRVCAGFNGAFNEIWWFYPSKNQNAMSPENDCYVIYNFDDGWWADGKMRRSFFTASPIEGFPFAGDPEARMVFQHERGYLNDGSPRGSEVFAEVGAVSFDDAENIWTVTRGQVDARNLAGADSKSVRYVFSGTTVRGKPFKHLGTHAVGTFGYLSPRFSAREFAYRVEGVADVPWSVGAVNFTAIKRGPV